MQFKKIVVIGPECTGKSMLCEQLANYYKTAWLPEYAREYLLNNGNKYEYGDLYKIAEGQVKGEELVVGGLKLEVGGCLPVFIDTDLYVIKIWSEFVFDKCDNRILKQIAKRNYDLYLLCQTDLPWVKDELREQPGLHTREKLFHYYKDVMINQKVPWVEISGNYDTRFQKAINAVEDLL